MSGLKLKYQTHARVLHGHPWVYAGEVRELLDSKWDGKIVELRCGEGRLLGLGFYNSQSQIVWRRLSRWRVADEAFVIRELLMRAVLSREGREARRLVWAEADGLPGLVVDQYGDVLVCQMSCKGIYKRREMIAGILCEMLKSRAVVLRNDSGTLKKEGLNEEVQLLHGEEPEPFVVEVGQAKMKVDVMKGQKTGLYLDQQEQYELIGGISSGFQMLDLFCHNGGFSIHAALGGAENVCGVDSSGPALEIARENAIANGVQAQWSEANVFDWIKQAQPGKWDLIVLDPPPFARAKGGVAEAMRGYKELNLRALKILKSGGFLATYSCSHHVTCQMFEEMVGAAAWDAHAEIRMVKRCAQPPDHPVHPLVPESEYLKGLLIQKL